MDDAYIVTHNVQVMRNGGNDPNFVGAPVLSGTTSIVHLVLIYIPSIFTSPLFAQYLISCLAVILYALGIIGLSLNRGLSRIQAALVTVLGLIAAEVPHQLLNGLETGLAMGALVWFLVFVSESRKAWIVSLLCGLLPFVRPELAVVSVVVFVRRIWIVWNQKDSMMGFFKEVRSSVVFLALGSIPWAMAYFFSMGSPYPTTISAKKYFFAEFAYETVPAAVALVFRGLATFLYKVGFLSVILAFFNRSFVGRMGILFLLVFLAAYLQLPGGLWHYEMRYLYVFIPIILSVLIHSLRDPSDRVRKWARIILVIALIQSFYMLPARMKAHLMGCQFTLVELGGVSTWCKDNIPDTALILVHDIGYISFATNYRMLDMVGLKSVESRALHKKYTYPSGGRNRAKAIHEMLLKYRPEYWIVLNGWNRVFRLTEGVKQYGWDLKLARSDGFYEVYRIGRR